MRSIGFVPLISHLAETFLPIYGGGGRLLLRGNAAYDNKAPLSTSAAGGAARFDPRQAPCLGLLLHRGAGTRSRVTMSVHGGDAGAAAAAAGGGGGGGGGKAFLVGSGIGGEEFLTVKGMELLKTADAVVYDALADEALLSLCKPSCEFHNVGKRGGERDTSTPQEEIDSLLVRLANSPGRASSSPSSSPDGKRVVRLKAGDPFIFGRSKGEIKALEAAGVPFEVVPGLSSAITGPLMAGIALTDPDLSKSFAVLSGFDKDSQMPDQVAGLRSVDTLVFLMSASRLPELVDRLVQGGFPGPTPVAIIKWAGHPHKQRVWRSQLQAVVSATDGEQLSPAVIVVGETAGAPLFKGLGEDGEVEHGSKGGEGQGKGGRGRDVGDVGGGLLIDRFETFLLDMDGVLWEGGHVLPGAVEAVAEMKKRGKRVLFVTNNSARTRAQVADKLNGIGPFNAEAKDVVTSGWAAARYLVSMGVKKCFMVGGGGLRGELDEAGVDVVEVEGVVDGEEGFKALKLDPQVGAVVSGVDFEFSWSKISVASAYLQSGCMLVGTNPDVGNRAGTLLMPENGVQLAALEAASGCKATIAGKPSKLLVDLVQSTYGIDPASTVMVGDRIDTDIEFGNAAGVSTALVLTGVTSGPEYESMAARGELEGGKKPTFVMEGLGSAVTGEGMRSMGGNRQ